MLNFFKQLREAYCEANLLEQKNAVFFFGESGVGKSIFIAYLLGCRLIFEGDDLVIESCPPGVHPPKVGLDIQSETIMPAAYIPSENSTIACVDYAGFNGNRDFQTNLLEFIATQRGMHSTASVLSLFVMLDYDSITEKRSAAMMEILDMIGSSIKTLQPDQIPSMHLVISHLPTTVPQKQKIIDRLIKLHEAVKEQLQTENTPERQAIERVLSYWVSLEGENNVLLFEPLSNATRNAFFANVAALSSVSPAGFDLTGSREMKQAFLSQMSAALNDGMSVLSFLQTAKRKEVFLDAKIRELRKRLIAEKAAVPQETPVESLAEDSHQIIEIQAMIDKKENEIRKLDSKNKYKNNETGVSIDKKILEARVEKVFTRAKLDEGNVYVVIEKHEKKRNTHVIYNRKNQYQDWN